MAFAPFCALLVIPIRQIPRYRSHQLQIAFVSRFEPRDNKQKTLRRHHLSSPLALRAQCATSSGLDIYSAGFGKVVHDQSACDCITGCRFVTNYCMWPSRGYSIKEAFFLDDPLSRDSSLLPPSPCLQLLTRSDCSTPNSPDDKIHNPLGF